MARRTLPTAPKTRVPGRLPASASSFVGRTAELAAVTDALLSSRLVTLAGPGGVGKTRVALAAVHAAGDRLGHPVFVDLTRIPEGAPVALAVAEAMGLRGVKRDGALDAILWWLDGGERVLLVLDNTEHVLEETAALVAELLEGAVHVPSWSRPDSASTSRASVSSRWGPCSTTTPRLSSGSAR